MMSIAVSHIPVLGAATDSNGRLGIFGARPEIQLSARIACRPLTGTPSHPPVCELVGRSLYERARFISMWGQEAYPTDDDVLPGFVRRVRESEDLRVESAGDPGSREHDAPRIRGGCVRLFRAVQSGFG